MVIFSGNCVRCGQHYTVPELEQSISCLEAKNSSGGFGGCRRGVNMDRHDPALECPPCSYALSLAEAYGGGVGGGGGGDGEDLVPAGCCSSSSSSGGGGGSSAGGSSRGGGGGGGGGGHSGHAAGKRRRVR
ncbi:hypothetical protein VPNG_10278 [Cytospora leucostoma]|uniref:Uncharacterized protein n=1 Tax=Cytospora leucostoma TaxID=1230097 RepID=A0A423VCR3_9PEZI|nr:hypothetical protein VPNG_10278 [Cytospora leucostoma]